MQGYGYAFAGRPLISEDGKTALVKGGLYASLIAVNLENGNSTWCVHPPPHPLFATSVCA